MRVTKYHGLGNDFIITTLSEAKQYNLSELAKSVCDRHTGIGADGLIVVKEKNLEMIYYNSDGSRAKMCGNGIRCFSKFVYDEGINRNLEFTVKTLAGHMVIHITSLTPFRCNVTMGQPDYRVSNIPVTSEQETFVNQQIKVLDKTFEVTSLLLGATHTVIKVNDLDTFNIKKYGKAMTELPIFPESTNANFYERINQTTIKMQTFERGAGLTLACGTGASAVAASLMDQDQITDTIKVILPLGTLYISQNDKGEIVMDGPAEKVMEGEYYETI